MDIDALKASLASTSTLRPHGKVKAVTGLSLRASLPGGRVGDVVLVRRRGQPLEAEIVGFVEGEVVAMPLGSLDGVGPDDPVESLGTPLQVSVGPGMLGAGIKYTGTEYSVADWRFSRSWPVKQNAADFCRRRRYSARLVNIR